MQFKALALLSALAVIGSAQDIDNNDVPNVCRSLCQSTVDLTTQCDRQNDDDDSGYINCVCSASNASSFVPACEACVAANDEADNDVRDIVRSCSFSSTTWNSASTGTATSGSASITPANSVTAVTTDSTGATVTSTGSSGTGSSGTGSSATGSSATGQVTVTATASAATGAAAPAATAGFGGLAVALLAGVPAFL